ncbi:PDZ domain-containing protein [Plantibacter sp. PA-3-X8]|uniref:S1C family serine protease n=1 Tax=Plantibacter sp. PA-3-X8 TaxID=2480625 RepID=UPI000F5EC7FA|nr:trypsin-like peptidase domain-containing protein [Plantibacter sp. PA-3-X8]AZH83423.1 PDZ domain-containing protein [Plantibacter sp. PA-3-X8]
MTDTADGQQPAEHPQSTPNGETAPQSAPAEQAGGTVPPAGEARPSTSGAYFPPPTAMPPVAPPAGQPTQQPYGAAQQGSPYQQAPQHPSAAFSRQQQPNPYAAYQQPTGQQPQPGQQHGPYGASPYAQQPTGQHPGVPTPPAARTKKTNRPLAGMVAMLAVGALIGGASGAGATLWVTNATKSSVSSNEAGSKAFTINDDADVSLTTAIAATAGPSVVTLSVQGGQSAGTGSGIILSKDGYVLTNTHVVTLDGQVADPTIRVTDANGKLYNAKIVGTDPIYDLAVIKLEDASGLSPMEFANSDKLNVGETAVAIGAPLGLAGTVTDGIVSALNRSITVASSAVPDSGSSDDGGSGDSNGDNQSPWNFDVPGQTTPTAPTSSISIAVIQTDAAINPGNSGGALVDGTGKLIGVNVAIASAGSTDSSSQSGSIGVGFAIPANIAKRVSDEIIKTGKATHGLLGATVKDASSDAKSTVAGALIDKVTDNGAAQAAGLKSGDIVTEFNGVPVTGANDLTAQVRALAAGATAKLTFTRGNDSQTAEVTLGELAL